MLHLYYGADDYRLREAYRELRAGLDGDGMLETNTTTLPPRGLSAGLLIQHVSTVPFLASARVVVVEGLLGALGGGRNVVSEWQPLLDVLPQLPPSNHLVLLEPLGGRDASTSMGRSALAKAVRELPGADVREFRELRAFVPGGRGENEVAAWARERARARGIAIAPAAVEELAGLVGSNLWALAAELEKLARYAEGRAISVEDVRLLTPEAQESSIFAVVDAVVEGRAAQALLQIRQRLESGSETPIYIQAMIARQLRHLVRAGELLEAGAPEQAVADATGVTGSYPLRKLIAQARAAGRAAAEAGLRAVEASDHAVKTGTAGDALALELLVMELASLLPRATPNRGRAAARR